MSLALIRRLLEERLAEFADENDLTVIFENTGQEAPTVRHLRSFVLPATTTSEDLEGAHRAYTGIYQVSIYEPARSGPGEVEALASQMEALFPVNLRLTSGSFSVQIITPMSTALPVPDPVNYIVPVFCTYRADTII